VLNTPTVQRMRMVAVPGRVISLSDELDDGPSRKAVSITIVYILVCEYVRGKVLDCHVHLCGLHVSNYSPSYVK